LTRKTACAKLGDVSKEDTKMIEEITTTTKGAPPKLTKEFGVRAHKNHEAIIRTGSAVAEGFLVMGSLLKANRDEQFFRAYGHEKFEHFLGSPELGMSRSMAFGLIQVHELYVQKLGRETAELTKAGIAKLLTIAPVVESNPDEWLGKCTMSRSDLKAEVDEARGIAPKELAPHTELAPDVAWDKVEVVVPSGHLYLEDTRHQPCCVCGEEKAEPAHFPITRGAGGEAVKDMAIPLCRKCHDEYHADPKEWTWKYRTQWAMYMYSLIFLNYPQDEAPKVETIELALPKVRKGKLIKSVRVVKVVKSASEKIAAAEAFIAANPEVKALVESIDMKKVDDTFVADGRTTFDVMVDPPAVTPEEEAEVDELSSDATLTPEELRAKYPEEEPLKRMEGFEVSFSKCSKCKAILPAEELEGGLCASCRG